jgi:Flp pilus assembly protein TadD
MTKKLLSYRFGVNGASSVERATKDVNLLLKQGFTLHQQGKLSQAQLTYNQILELQPNNFDALQLLGVISAQNKNHTLAIELFNKAIEINPGYAEAFSNRGIALRELKKLDEGR